MSVDRLSICHIFVHISHSSNQSANTCLVEQSHVWAAHVEIQVVVHANHCISKHTFVTMTFDVHLYWYVRLRN